MRIAILCLVHGTVYFGLLGQMWPMADDRHVAVRCTDCSSLASKHAMINTSLAL
jgi:hypothetical protein